LIENCEEGGMYHKNKVFTGINKSAVFKKTYILFEKIKSLTKSWKKVFLVFFLMQKKLLKKDGSSKITGKIKKNFIKEL